MNLNFIIPFVEFLNDPYWVLFFLFFSLCILMTLQKRQMFYNLFYLQTIQQYYIQVNGMSVKMRSIQK